MSDHRTEYLATVAEYNELARSCGLPTMCCEDVQDYDKASLQLRAAMLLEVGDNLRALKRILAEAKRGKT